ncbi:MAG: hypothetical protein WAM70_20460 [Pyrinomonadaceae bacterium]
MSITLSKLLCFAGIVISLASGWASPGLAFSQGREAAQHDLSTDEGVAAAVETLTGKKMDRRSLTCIRRDRELPLVVVGNFAFDRGCAFEGVFVNGRYFGQSEAASSEGVLDTLGWKTANQEQREKLVQAWVVKGLLAFVKVLHQKNEDFENRSFQPPQVVSKEAGEISITLWLRMPSGRSRGRSYILREYRFSKDGVFIGSSKREDFTALKDDASE